MTDKTNQPILDAKLVDEMVAACIARLLGETEARWERELETLRAERRAILAEIRAGMAEARLALAGLAPARAASEPAPAPAAKATDKSALKKGIKP